MNDELLLLRARSAWNAAKRDDDENMREASELRLARRRGQRVGSLGMGQRQRLLPSSSNAGDVAGPQEAKTFVGKGAPSHDIARVRDEIVSVRVRLPEARLERRQVPQDAAQQDDSHGPTVGARAERGQAASREPAQARACR